MENIFKMSNIANYMDKHTQDPFYLACQRKQNGEVISLSLQNKLLEQYQNQKETQFKLNLFYELFDNNPTFLKQYQEHINNTKHQQINNSLITKIMNNQNKSIQNIHIHQILDFEYDKQNSNPVYNELYLNAVMVVRSAIMDVDTYPYPFYLPNNEQKVKLLSLNLNLKLLEEVCDVPKMKSVFQSDVDFLLNKKLLNENGDYVKKLEKIFKQKGWHDEIMSVALKAESKKIQALF